MSECWNWYTAWTEAPRGNYSREGSSPSSLTKRGRLAQWLERLIYIQKVIGPNPIPPTRRGSSVVEHSSEKAGVVSSILTRGTCRNYCGCSTMVVHLVANQSMWVRFPSPAPVTP